MEFLTSKQKKSKARRLYLGYILLSILVSLASYILISTALGFEIFSSKGEVIQNGLIVMDSNPDGANVFINDRKESNDTNARYSLPESTYTILLKKEGYRDWRTSVSLVGGTVKLLTYPRLMPKTPAVLTDSSVDSSTKMLQSRDNRWVVSYSKSLPSTILLSDLESPDSTAIQLQLPISITANRQVSSLTLQEWSADNTHFLVSLQLADTNGPVYAVLHRERVEEAVNVTSVLSLAPTDQVGLWNGKRDEVYVQRVNGSVFLGRLRAPGLDTQPLIVDTVEDFYSIDNEQAVYTTRASDTVSVKYYSDGASYTVTTLTEPTKPIVVKSFRYNRNNYLVLGGEGFEKTYIYRNFDNAVKNSATRRVAPYFILPTQSTVAEISRQERFVMVSDGSNAQVYDVEQKELYRYELPIEKPGSIGWFDESRLYAVGSDKKLSVFDFTGDNVYVIADSVTERPLVNGDVSAASYLTGSSTTASRLVTIDIKEPSL